MAWMIDTMKEKLKTELQKHTQVDKKLLFYEFQLGRTSAK